MIQVMQFATHPVVKAMAAHPTVELVQEHGSGCLLKLLGPDEKDDRTTELESAVCKVTDDILESNGVAVMLAAMRAHPTASKIQRHVCIALRELMETMNDNGDQGEVEDANKALQENRVAQAKQVAEVAKAENAVGLIATALIKHPDEKGVQDFGGEALDLLEPEPTAEENTVVRDSHALLARASLRLTLTSLCVGWARAGGAGGGARALGGSVRD